MDEQTQASSIANLSEDQWPTQRVSPEPKPSTDSTTTDLHTVTLREGDDDPLADLQTAALQATQASRRMRKLHQELKERHTQLETQLDTEKKTNSKLLYCNQQLGEELSQLRHRHDQLKSDFETIKTEFDASARTHEANLEELESNKALAHKARSDNHQLQRKAMEQEEMIRALQKRAKLSKQQTTQTSETINAIRSIMHQLDMTQANEQADHLTGKSTDDSFEAWLGKKKREDIY